MELKKVTKHQALEDFVVNRVIGEDAFAIRIVDHPGLGAPGPFSCVYDRRVNGGCAIGKWIPEVLYRSQMENTTARVLFDTYPEIAACFESAEQDRFWSRLQLAHDSLAKHMFILQKIAEGKTEWRGESLTYQRDNTWTQFEQAMKQAVLFAD